MMNGFRGFQKMWLLRSPGRLATVGSRAALNNGLVARPPAFTVPATNQLWVPCTFNGLMGDSTNPEG
jgi:hypothetical protein